jgi:hypothetical protein
VDDIRAGDNRIERPRHLDSLQRGSVNRLLALLFPLIDVCERIEAGLNLMRGCGSGGPAQ